MMRYLFMTLIIALGCDPDWQPDPPLVEPEPCNLPSVGDTCPHQPADRDAVARLLGDLAECAPGEMLIRRVEPDLTLYRCEAEDPVNYGYPAGWVGEDADRFGYQGDGRSLVECDGGRVASVRRLLTNGRWFWIGGQAGEACDPPDCHRVPCEAT